MAQKTDLTLRKKIEKQRLKVAAILILVAIPVVIVAGWHFLPAQWYMPLSVVVLILTMAPFFMIFENRRPRAREIVLLAMMSALTVVAHLFFHVIFPIQIGTAMVIIAGISLGPEAGFLVGALSRFVCNFYMGQGPWTPWQMFCWGILGFLAGLSFSQIHMAGDLTDDQTGLFKRIAAPVIAVITAFAAAYVSYLIVPSADGSILGWRWYAFGAAGLVLGAILQRKKLPINGFTMAFFTFVTTFVIYGGIMNFSSLILSVSQPGAEAVSTSALRVLYLSGAPYDLMHGLTAAVCIFLIGPGMIRKLERIKIKYGIYK